MADTTYQGATPYCTAAQLLTLCSWSILADWASDDPDAPRPTKNDLLDPNHPAGAIIVSHLAYASGEVEAACVRGGRYAPADLAGLTGNPRQSLASLVGWLAIGGLYATKSPGSELEIPGVKVARERLESLRVGETIFGITANVVSGAGASVAPLHEPGSGGRTVSMAARFFGRRGAS